MEKLALDFNKQIDNLIESDQRKEELYQHLRLYNDRVSSVEDLVSNMRSIISHPDQLTLFDDSKCIIRQEDQTIYGNIIPKYEPKRTRNVLLSVSAKERIGFSMRGGVEHNIGFFVVGIEPASAAERCGIQVGDELLRVNSYNLTTCTHREASSLISNNKTMLSLKIRHIGMIPIPSKSHTKHLIHRWVFAKKNNSVDLPTKDYEEEDTVAIYALPKKKAYYTRDDQIIVTINWEGHAAIGFNIVDMKAGVFVSFVKEDTPAEKAGIEVGDEILEVNGVNFRQAEAAEVAIALKDSKTLQMLVRKVTESRNRGISSTSMNFSDPVTTETQSQVEIEEKIEQLFESNLAKTAELVKKQGRRGSILDFDENLPPPPDFLVAGEVIHESTERHTSETPNVNITYRNDKTIYTHAEVHVAAEDTQKDHPVSHNGVTNVLPTLLQDSEPFISEQSTRERKISSSSQTNTSTSSNASSETSGLSLYTQNSRKISPGSNNGGVKQRIYERENPRQKLESELRERLKIERQKRLVEEKSLRISRLRQELKETEREEARLQKWLADSEIAEEQHHTVGFYNYKPQETILDEVPTQEFDLTTPPDMRYRNTRTSLSQDDKRGWPPPPPLNDIANIQNREKVRLEKQIDGKKIVISELKEKVKKQAFLGVSDGIEAVGNSRTHQAGELSNYTKKPAFAAINPPKINPVNEITFF